MTQATTRVFSGIQPTGDLHLGNHLGAIRNWVRMQHETDAIFCVVDLHSITVPQEPGSVRAATLQLSQLLMAAGLDPEVCTLFVQSHVREHAECAWLMECTVSFGELSRMTQFKDKSDRQQFISAGLFTYPALQAADILLYDTDEVPVGDDQRQHIEITRDIAERFNSRHGETFVLPKAVIPRTGARVMDLQRPADKMSKSLESPRGTINLLDEPKQIEKKIKSAVTDNDAEVRYDVDAKPGVSNLLSILGAATDRDPEALAGDYSQYGPLKVDTAEAVVELLRPLQERFRELEADPGETARLLRLGADKARETAAVTLARAKTAIGLLPGDL
jgi:tryptophanyl-tRNA synthetase